MPRRVIDRDTSTSTNQPLLKMVSHFGPMSVFFVWDFRVLKFCLGPLSSRPCHGTHHLNFVCVCVCVCWVSFLTNALKLNLISTELTWIFANSICRHKSKITLFTSCTWNLFIVVMCKIRGCDALLVHTHVERIEIAEPTLGQ